MSSSTNEDTKLNTQTKSCGNVISAKIAEIDIHVTSSSRDFNIRTVPSNRTNGQALLRYSPKIPAIQVTSTKG